MPRVAVIGCGLWGKNLVRNFNNLQVLEAICDTDIDRIKLLTKEYREVKVYHNLDDVLSDPEVTAVAIATPSDTHYQIAMKCLKAYKHVYVEKPIATTSNEAIELNEEADKNRLVLMVGHLLLYHPAVNRLKTLIAEGYLGKICHIQSDRLNYNPRKNDLSVIWDLAPHDISMMSFVLDMDPLQVKSALGYVTTPGRVMDVAHIDLLFPEGVSGHVHNSWIHPNKQVKLLVRGTEMTAILDDTETSHKLHLYSNIAYDNRVVEYPDYIDIEPLKLECQHYINCINKQIKPRSDGLNGYKVVKILEEAEKILSIVPSALTSINPH
ncbi:MAG: Gfo/Idh/MocA family oxidoreductase [Cyanobacteriota bacterium]